ncbi:tetratricopeptide repeat protein [Mucilaginibacter ximonensis]|uniref:Tetratricopeptide repeat protein n=1 Tax=Mucilaginibacter ximonensis TaxID=538021 RepID=A0ABW5YF90_9SPHI
MRLSVLFSILVFSTVERAAAQNAYTRLGQQAYIDGNFKVAIAQLEKGRLIDSTDASALWMLGYSYFHNENFAKSIAAFTKEIAIEPADAHAYYYRAKAQCHLGLDSQVPTEKEKYFLGSIIDLTKAISINPAEARMTSFYLNRGVAYKEYGFFRLQQNMRLYDKARGINSLKAAIADFQKVLDSDRGRQDIIVLIDECKEKLSTVLGHH